VVRGPGTGFASQDRGRVFGACAIDRLLMKSFGAGAEFVGVYGSGRERRGEAEVEEDDELERWLHPCRVGPQSFGEGGVCLRMTVLRGSKGVRMQRSGRSVLHMDFLCDVEILQCRWNGIEARRFFPPLEIWVLW